MIRHYIAPTFIFSVLFLAPGIQAAQQQGDKLDDLLKQFVCYKEEETVSQKSWRLAKEYGPFAASVALGSYLACKSMPHHGHLDRVPGFLVSSINAYALYKSYTMTKEWLKQLPNTRKFPVHLLAPLAASLVTYNGFEYFFEPSYIAALSSVTLLVTSFSNCLAAYNKHKYDKSIIDATETNLVNKMLNDVGYNNLKKSRPNKKIEETDKKTQKREVKKYHGLLYTTRRENERIAAELKRNVFTIIKQPWGSQFFAGLSKNSRHAMYKSVGWQIDDLKDKLDMKTKNYPEEFVMPNNANDLYAPIEKS